MMTVLFPWAACSFLALSDRHLKYSTPYVSYEMRARDKESCREDRLTKLNSTCFHLLVWCFMIIGMQHLISVFPTSSFQTWYLK